MEWGPDDEGLRQGMKSDFAMKEKHLDRRTGLGRMMNKNLLCFPWKREEAGDLPGVNR